MKRRGILITALLVLSFAGFGQSMMQSSTTSAGIAGMSAANTATADPKVGHALRVAKSTGRKVIFTTIADALALAAKGPTVLFFAADWCPYCQADLKDINANADQIADITIVVVDYDVAKDLEKTYGVTAQDTFVQVNAKGKRLAIWNGGGVDGIRAYVVRG
jgi:thiol-disulfide isomerase/thioredoxin